MARAGLTLEQMAEELGIASGTMDKWRAKHPELKDAMKPGVDFVDALVEGSLLKRALGYEVVEVIRERVPVGFNGTVPTRWAMKITKRLSKHVPGEVGAQCFWLKNRKGWRDSIDMKHSGAITTRQDFSALSDDELRQVVALADKLEVPVAGRN
jgi:transcriptional regulator with XRE-family HTH domain